MTMPRERARSLYDAGELLQEILLSEPGREADASLRLQIQSVLRHYPSKNELDLLVRDVTRHCPRAMLQVPTEDNA